jgi:cupin superfamily acireductone dioxygenase involved in methionine salvage
MALLNEGISNLEDLDIKTFIDYVRRLDTMHASEKLDGTGIYFGLDAQGQLVTSRAGNNQPLYHAADEYPYFAANNALRAAHEALQGKLRDLQACLAPGDMIEAEVLHGRQPNTISYGLDDKNFIAILGSANDTNQIKADQLAGALLNQEISVKTIIVDSEDGENLDRKLVTQKFRFVGPQKIDVSKVKGLNVEKHLKKLESFLETSSGVNNLSNFELMTVSLGSIPKDERVQAKEVKDRIIAEVKSKFKVQIKKELLDKIVGKTKPLLGAGDLNGDEDVGIAGVVLRDPETGEQIKLVDKDGFSTLNTFNYAVRNQIAGNVRTLDDQAPIESRGGITGVMKIRIAKLLGNPELAMGRTAKQIFRDNKGDTPTQTLKKVAAILNGQNDFNGVKMKVVAVVKATSDELVQMLADFKKHKDDPEVTYRLKMKNGKTIGLSPEVVKRTLITFAETKRNLGELQANVEQTKSFDNLIGVLYGRAAREAHEEDGEDQIDESLKSEVDVLLEKRNYTDTDLYRQIPDAWTMLNIYLATVMMATVIFKANDKRGERLLRDKAHWRMTKWTNEMSAVNFWGIAIWNPKRPAIAKLLNPKVAHELAGISGKVPDQWVRNLHMDLSFDRDVPIDWEDHYKTMKYLIQHSHGNNSDRVNSLLRDAFDYEELDHDSKVKFLPKLYFFARQFVPTSPLITRIRVINNEVLGGDGELPMPVTDGQTTKLLGEDGEIAPGPGAGAANPSAPAGSTSLATNSGAVSSVQGGGLKKRKTVMRRRNPDAIAAKFEKPKDEE